MPTELKVFNINISKQMPSTMTLKLLNDITIKGLVHPNTYRLFPLENPISIGYSYAVKKIISKM